MSSIHGLTAMRPLVRLYSCPSLLDAHHCHFQSFRSFAQLAGSPYFQTPTPKFLLRTHTVKVRKVSKQAFRHLLFSLWTRSFGTSSPAPARQPASTNSSSHRRHSRNPARPSAQTYLRDSQHKEALNSDSPRASEGELSLPNGELNEADIVRIFGQGIVPQTGNRILRILQWRRASGALAEQGVSFSNIPELTRPVALDALEYLRETYPIDEAAAAAHWAEQTAEALENELSQRGIDFGLYKNSEARPQQKDPNRQENDPAFSVLEQRQRDTVARSKAQREAVGDGSKNTFPGNDTQHAERSLMVARSDQAAELKLATNAKWVEEISRKATVSQDIDVPDISFLRRILPSTFAAIAVIMLSLIFASAYLPPSNRSGRIFPDIPPAFTTCAAIVATNVLVFGLWHFPPAWRLLNRYMLIVPAWPQPAGILGNTFSHQKFGHLFWNMIALMVIGPSVHEQVGRGDFMALYIASGVCGSWASLVSLVGFRQFQHYSMGASAAVYGLLGAMCALNPSEHLRIPLPKLNEYEIPFSSGALITVIIALELVTMIFRPQNNISHMSHIGGALWGIGHAYFISKNYAQKPKPEEDLKGARV